MSLIRFDGAIESFHFLSSSFNVQQQKWTCHDFDDDNDDSQWRRKARQVCYLKWERFYDAKILWNQ